MKYFLYTGVASVICLLNFRQAFANEAQKSKIPITNIPQLNQVQFPKTSVRDLLAQENPTTSVIQVTGVRLQTNNNNLEIVLETPIGQLSQPTTKSDGNTLIADIQNAVLALPDSKDFSAKNPAAGIALVTVTQLDGNKVRVRVTGSDGVPTASSVTSDRGLTLSLSPVLPSDIELVVTAQKKYENPQDVPISLTVLPQQELEDAQINSVRDVAANTANFFTRKGRSHLQFPNYSRVG